jgi:hypothetical protein
MPQNHILAGVAFNSSEVAMTGTVAYRCGRRAFH